VTTLQSTEDPCGAIKGVQELAALER
jgi:hypothetical protein